MAKYVTLGQLKTQMDTMFRSLKLYLDDTLTAPVKSLAQQAKALADEVVRRADAGEFKGAPGRDGAPGAPGRDGSDAEVTAGNIVSALGYTPVSADDYSPVDKTAAMTQSVGRDGDGRLWTAPGGGGGGSAVWGGIAGEIEDQTDLAEALEEAAYDDTALSGRVTAIEGKEAGWDGKYSKPSGGIPKTDLASAVQTSLGRADTALQQHQSLAAYRTSAAQDAIDSGKVDKVSGKGLSANDYTNTAKAKVDAIPADPKYTDTVYDDTALSGRVAAIEGKESSWNGKYSKPSGGIPKSDLASAVQTSLGRADTALQQHQSLTAYRTAANQDTIDQQLAAEIALRAPSANPSFSGAVTVTGSMVVSGAMYGTTLPASGTEGQLFFLMEAT